MFLSVFYLNVYTMFYHFTNISTILIKFINIFYAFAWDNNFCFFEYVNKLLHTQIQLILLIEFRMILRLRQQNVLLYRQGWQSNNNPEFKVCHI